MTYRTRNILIAVLLLAVGIIATSAYVKGQADKAQRGQELVEVLVAKERISAGTPADELLSGNLVEVRTVRADDEVAGAVDDAEFLGDRAATATIYPGDQISARKFVDTSQLPATSQVTGTERLISFPVGNFQAVSSSLRSGDRVDIWASAGREYGGPARKDDEDGARPAGSNTPVTWIVARDVLVTDVPAAAAGDAGSGSNNKADFPVLTFKVSDAIAEKMVFAFAHSDGSGLFLAARPTEGATQTKLPGLRFDHE